MRIVVTGASGFIGGPLVRRLSAAGYDVIGVGRSVEPGASFRRIEGYGQTPGGDVLIHLAEGRDRRHTEAEGETSAQRSIRAVEVLLEKGFSRVVYASSAAVYGEGSTQPHGTDDVTAPTDLYARTKVACEGRVLERDGIIARLGNVYGPGMSVHNVVSTILRQIPGVGPVRVMDDQPIRDFVWVEDAVRAFGRMVEHASCGVYNVGSGIGTSVRDLAGLALRIVQQPERAIVAVRRSAGVSCITLDVSRTIRDLEWHPQTSIVEGLEQLVRLRSGR